MPELTVVIPVYNNPEGAKDLVADFYRLHDPEMFRIVVIDQTKEGIDFAEQTVHLHVRSYRNLGFSKAMNTGWKLVTTPYTLLANDDVRLLHPSWYEDAKAHFEHEDVLAVNPFPATRTWDGGGTAVNYWDLPKNEGKFDFLKDKPFESYTEEDYRQLQKLLWSGCSGGTTMFFTLLRTEARELVGLLDEAYWNNGEDYDLNRRIFLTCSVCKKRAYEHPPTHDLKPFRILTCSHSLVHHQCGVTKTKATAQGAASAYDLILKAKNIFNTKWGDETHPSPDIYGRDGRAEPSTPWFTEIPL